MKKLLLLVFVFLPVILYGWTTPIDISQAPYVSNNPDIIVDKYNRIHVVWENEAIGDLNYEILYRCCVGDSWGSIVNLSNDSTHSHTPKIACDTLGNPHVLWVDWGTGYVTGELRYAYFDGENWQEQVNLSDTFSLSGGRVDIGVDTSNNIHIVWCDLASNEEIYYSLHNGNSWSIPATNISNNSDDDVFPCIAIASEIHVVWMAGPASPADSIEIYYSKYDTMWSTLVNISNLVGPSQEPKICCDFQGNPHVAWRESNGSSYVYYTSCNGDSWTAPYKVSIGVDPVISLDSYNHVHIVYDWYDLHYTYYDGNVWSDSVMVWDSPVNALLPALTIDKSNCLHLVWTEAIDGDTGQIYYSKLQLTGIEEESVHKGTRAQALKLIQNYPNPFSQKTKIVYILSEGSEVGIIVYDLAGRVVKDFDLGCKPAGLHTFQLFPESFTKGGESVAGIYFCVLKAGKYTAVRKIIMLR